MSLASNHTQRKSTWRTRSASLLLALICIVATLSCILKAQAQGIDSQYPSRSAILSQSDNSTSKGVHKHERRKMAGRTVLGYTSPWNPQGAELVEEYRGKFDVVVPCWHTVDIVRAQKGGEAFYEVRGEMTERDRQWKDRLQVATREADLPGHNTSDTILSSAEQDTRLPPVKVLPRFALDRWTPEDLAEMLTKEEHLEAFSSAVMTVIEEAGYDGLVIESNAVWAMKGLVEHLAALLRANDKQIGVVLPPLRTGHVDAEVEKTNRVVLHSIKTLGPIADFVHIMTYDYTGMNGQAFEDVYDTSSLPEGSPLAQDGVRTPGPNTPISWLEGNIEMLSGSLETPGAQNIFETNDMGHTEFVNQHGIADKLLFGVALYGYSYPVGWFETKSASKHGVPRIPPPSPLVSKDNSTSAQEAARAKADKKDEELAHRAVLRFAGDAFTQRDLVGRLKVHKALIRLDEESQEQFLDYVAVLPPSQQPDPKELPEGYNKGQPMASYYRAYFPSAHTISKRLSTVAELSPAAGVAFWDVGQAGRWLLEAI
ncbi:Predicted member of glycosyl hydrolase family 18 [Ceraceosorus bombacis]|uniref:Chitinase domain-containing protein 1 n=1 Tax=Ceraceosorus bombacis TaxID=401625 RepID=A0A0N7LA90_9BASI|nr:Predicted member of glycosyl hydrolase family 18 [Ceraceosorus bombacis]